MTYLRTLIFAVGVLFALMVPLNVSADNVGEAKVYGKTYGEWSAEWWQWGHSLPSTIVPHPVLDAGTAEEPLEVDCSLGQKGPVYFLAGLAYEGVPEEPTVLTGMRSCEVPQGTALFFPIVNVEFINTPGDEFCFDQPEPGVYVYRPCTEAEKRAILDSIVVGARFICSAYVGIDGEPAVTLLTGRTQSPAYTIEAGADDPFGIPDGIVDDIVVSDGYWMMVPPLDKGQYVLTFRGSFCFPEDPGDPYSDLVAYFGVEMTYELQAVPGR